MNLSHSVPRFDGSDAGACMFAKFGEITTSC